MKETLLTIIITIVFLLVMFSISFYLKKLFNEARKTKCFYCNKQLGKEYDLGKTRYKILKDKDLWAHTRCIPKEKLKDWRLTH